MIHVSILVTKNENKLNYYYYYYYSSRNSIPVLSATEAVCWRQGAAPWGVPATGGLLWEGGCLLQGGACSGGVPVPGGACSRGVPGHRGVPALEGACSGGCLVETPPPTATVVGSMHPTGMHSCF